MTIRIAVAQLDPVVGDFESNLIKIKEAYQRACSEQARVLVTPELGICGYPPLDLVERPEMIDRCEKTIQELMILTQGQKCALIVGHVGKNPSPLGRPIQNVATILENGKRVFSQAKMLLPTYDVLDEARYFEPAKDVHLWECEGYQVAIAICEDLWGEDTFQGRRLYHQNPVDSYEKLKADLVISLSSSPYEWGKREKRENLHSAVAVRLKAPVIYVNQMGATDEILFDGGSFACNSRGEVVGRLPFFKTSFGVVSVLDEASVQWNSPGPEAREDTSPSEIEILTRGLCVGIRDYFAKTGFKTAILGLSGGIDSAIVAVLAAHALGPKNILGVAMPSQYSSSHSLEDAEILAKNLGIRFEVKPIKFLYSTSSRELAEGRGTLAPLALENLQSRLRGVVLMTLSNHYSSLVLTTGNKSEFAMGYCTLYGDMAGALAPLGDLFKTRVYELARYLNQIWKKPIPERSITKPPSAELRPDQVDQDTLPAYELLDSILADYIENGVSLEAIRSKYEGSSEKSKNKSTPGALVSSGASMSVDEILRRLEMNEFKRRQAAPILKVSHKAFGIGRRVPIAKTWGSE